MDDREAVRVATCRSVTCFYSDTSFEAELFDLSVGGCLIDAVGVLLEPERAVGIDFLGSVHQEGVIVWTRDGFAGVKFDTQIHEAIVRHLSLRHAAYLSMAVEKARAQLPTWQLSPDGAP